MELTTLYKGDPDVGDAQEVTFTTERHSSKCGVYLEVGEEYLIGLDQKNDDGDLTANSCGLVEEWSSVSDEDKASVEDACEDDLCNGACSEFMVRERKLVFTAGTWGWPSEDSRQCGCKTIQ